MRIVYLLPFMAYSLFGADTSSCKLCHPIIYGEFEKSMHKNSTPKSDKIHKAIWDMHPDKKSGKYSCAKCHSPNIKGKDPHSGIDCLSCHKIKSIEKHYKSNSNIYENDEKTLYSAQKGMENKKVEYRKKSSWFGLITTVEGSPYHDVDYRNGIYYNGKVCMGCHSHKRNDKGLELCRTNEAGAKDNDSNCITCHMPKIKGSATNIRISKTHAYHGFSGVINEPKMLSQYIDLEFKRGENGFSITIDNKTPHNLLLHPLRVLQLRVNILRDGKRVELKRYSFKRVLGTDGKASMPWLATEVIEDSTIKANENRTIKFSDKLKKGDEVEVTLGFYLVNPKSLKSIGLDSESELKKFITLKREYFRVD